MNRLIRIALAALLFAPAALVFAGGTRESGSGIALVGATVIDGTGSPARPDGVVFIDGAQIAWVSAEGARAIPRGSRVLSVRGMTIVPGFINAHVHRAYDRNQLSRWLRAGVTAVRDLGPLTSVNFIDLRDSLNREPNCARIISATPLITAPGGYGSLPVSSAAEAESTVRGLLDAGYDVVKIAIEDDLQGRTWPLISAEAARRIVQVAHSRGVRVSAHISHVRNLALALDAGVDDLAHMVVEPLSDAQIAEVVRRGVYWEPTLELWKGVSEIHGLNWDDIAVENLGRFYRAGGKIALGTDFAGYRNPFDLDFPITEVMLMAKAGMTSMDIIVAGTRNAAIVSGRGKALGTLAPGRAADLVVLNGNPLDDLSALTRPAMVIHDGRVVPLR